VKWLLTVSSDVDADAAAARLEEVGATVEYGPVPMDQDDQVLEVDGPADLPSRLAAEGEPWVKQVSPNSEQSLY
jgi:hypothetical protein